MRDQDEQEADRPKQEERMGEQEQIGKQKQIEEQKQMGEQKQMIEGEEMQVERLAEDMSLAEKERVSKVTKEREEEERKQKEKERQSKEGTENTIKEADNIDQDQNCIKPPSAVLLNVEEIKEQEVTNESDEAIENVLDVRLHAAASLQDDFTQENKEEKAENQLEFEPAVKIINVEEAISIVPFDVFSIKPKIADGKEEKNFNQTI